MDNITNRLKRLAKAIAYHDLAFGDAPVISNVQDNKAEHMSLSTIVLNLEEMAGDIQESADWKEMRDAIWDPDTFNTDIKYQILEDIASEPQTRVIKLPSILAESEFDELLDIVKMKYPTTEIYGSDIWRH